MEIFSLSCCTPCNEWLYNPAPCGLILELVWCVHTLAMAEGQGSRAATLLAAPRQGLGNPRSALPVNAGVQWLAPPGVWRAGSASTQGIFAPAWFTEVWWYLQGHPEDERADGTSHHCRGLRMESRAKGITWCHTSLVDRQHVHEWKEECERFSGALFEEPSKTKEGYRVVYLQTDKKFHPVENKWRCYSGLGWGAKSNTMQSVLAGFSRKLF